jgi:hypothetical protein
VRHLAYAAILAIAVSQASACARSISVFEQAFLLKQAGESFTVVTGHFTLDPGVEGAASGDDTVRFRGRLEGRTLPTGGPSRAYAETVGWVESRYDALFTHPLPDGPSIAFVRETANGPAIVTGICGGGYFLTDEATIETFETCLRDGACPDS